NAISYIDREGRMNTCSYDPAGRLISKSIDGCTQTYTYTAAGKLDSVTDPTGAKILYEYNGNGKLTGITDANGHKSSFEYGILGNPLHMSEGSGAGVSYSYNEAGQLTGIINDGAQKGILYEYDSLGRRIKETDARGYSTSYEYDPAGNLIKTTDAFGRAEIIKRDPMGRILSETDAAGNTTSYGYDSSGRLIFKIDASGAKTSMSYDLAGRLTSTTDPKGGVTSYSYDGLGRLTSQTDAAGNTTKFNYSGVNLTEIYDAAGNLTRYGYDRRNLIMYEVDARDNPAKREYDRAGRIVSKANRTMGYDRYAYDPAGNLTEETNAAGGIVKYVYDGADRLSARTDEAGNTTKYSYTTGGVIDKITYPDESTKSFEYDENLNLIKVIDGMGNATSYTYDALNRISACINSDGTSRIYSYDRAGNLEALTDEAGNRWEYGYDALGNKTFEKDPLGNTAFYEYDKNSNLTKIILKGNSESTTFAGIPGMSGMKGAAEAADMNSIAGTAGFAESFKNIQNSKAQAQKTQITSYEYDVLNRPVKRTDAMGNTVSYEYDSVGNLIKKTDEEGGITSYEYDPNANLTKTVYPDGSINTFTYDGDNRLIGYTDPTGNTNFTRDALGRMTQAGSYAGGVRYEYDPVGNVTMVDGFMLKTHYTYDSMGRMTGIENKGMQNDTFKFSYEYNAAGEITRITKPDKSVEQRSYDSMGRLVKVDIDGIQSGIYQYDSTGNLKNKTENLSGVKIESEYKYDKNNRLIEEYILGAAPKRSRYSYDGFGNIVNEYEEGSGKSAPVNTRYEYNSLNQLTKKVQSTSKENKQSAGSTAGINPDSAIDLGIGSAVGTLSGRQTSDSVFNYEYDKKGNLISLKEGGETVASYKYGAAGRMIKASAKAGDIDYRYDALGHLVRSGYSDFTPNYISDIDMPFIEHIFGGGFGEKITHVYGPEGEAGTYADYRLYCLTKDRLGSTVMAKDTEGEVVSGTYYNAWGEAVNTYTKAGFEKSILAVPSYTGHRYDNISGLYYAKARMYSADDKRFTSIDPIKDGLNWYEYCMGDPQKYTDPSGYARGYGPFEAYSNHLVHIVPEITNHSLNNEEKKLVNKSSDLGWEYMKAADTSIEYTDKIFGEKLKKILDNDDNNKDLYLPFTSKNYRANLDDNTIANAYHHIYWNAVLKNYYARQFYANSYHEEYTCRSGKVYTLFDKTNDEKRMIYLSITPAEASKAPLIYGTKYDYSGKTYDEFVDEIVNNEVKKWTDAHENGNNDSAAKMDYKNNAIGYNLISAAATKKLSDKDISMRVLKHMSKGKGIGYELFEDINDRDYYSRSKRNDIYNSILTEQSNRIK
ncbi:hypothetical protein HMPREF9333_00486, partial [Johnsonella ignava ATCC 51276]